MSADPDRGAYRYEYERLLLGVIAVVGVLVLLYRCTNDPGLGATAPTRLAGIGTVSMSTASPAATPGSAGELTAGGTALLPLSEVAAADGSLTVYIGEPALGRGVTVLSVPADEGFWVGTSESDRVWVELIGSGESPYTVRPGDRAQFTGEVVAQSADYARRACAGDEQSVELLAAQRAHIEVPMDQLVLNP